MAASQEWEPQDHIGPVRLRFTEACFSFSLMCLKKTNTCCQKVCLMRQNWSLWGLTKEAQLLQTEMSGRLHVLCCVFADMYRVCPVVRDPTCCQRGWFAQSVCGCRGQRHNAALNYAHWISCVRYHPVHTCCASLWVDSEKLFSVSRWDTAVVRKLDTSHRYWWIGAVWIPCYWCSGIADVYRYFELLKFTKSCQDFGCRSEEEDKCSWL